MSRSRRSLRPNCPTPPLRSGRRRPAAVSARGPECWRSFERLARLVAEDFGLTISESKADRLGNGQVRDKRAHTGPNGESDSNRCGTGATTRLSEQGAATAVDARDHRLYRSTGSPDDLSRRQPIRESSTGRTTTPWSAVVGLLPLCQAP